MHSKENSKHFSISRRVGLSCLWNSARSWNSPLSSRILMGKLSCLIVRKCFDNFFSFPLHFNYDIRRNCVIHSATPLGLELRLEVWRSRILSCAINSTMYTYETSKLIPRHIVHHSHFLELKIWNLITLSCFRHFYVSPESVTETSQEISNKSNCEIKTKHRHRHKTCTVDINIGELNFHFTNLLLPFYFQWCHLQQTQLLSSSSELKWG